VNIYHITPRKNWIDATRTGSYTASSLASEGFIHCSTAAQLLPVARTFYHGQTGLVLLVIDSRRLTAKLRWEGAPAPEGLPAEATFPHVYGPIGLEAVTKTIDFEPNGDGEFTLPPLPQENATAGGS
jgi:uncharacterized protein (DUF952 family)